MQQVIRGGQTPGMHTHRNSPGRSQEKLNLQHLDLGLPASRTVRKAMSVV